MSGYVFDASKITRSHVLKAVAVALVGYAGYSFLPVAPKMASSAGAPVNEVLTSIVPMIGGIFAWFAANWAKVSPDMVQALVALVKSPQDVTAWIRVLTGLAVILRAANPQSKALDLIVQASEAFHDELRPSPSEVKPG